LDLGPPSENELKRYTDYERLLDNAKYQPQDLEGSCTALSIDPEFPNLPSMNPTIRLEGWQVRGELYWTEFQISSTTLMPAIAV
jgi:hypothetical protein